MSHFTVLVVGEEVEEQLAPYNEDMQVAPYKSYIDKDSVQRMAGHYKIKVGSKSYKDKLVERMLDWTGSKGGHDDKGLFSWSTYNRNSKWDWYAVGGRWLGFFKLKKGKTGELGDAGVFDNKAEAGHADVVRKGDVNFEAMLEDGTTFAVVKDGRWYDRGQMGWWAIVLDEKDNDVWDKEWHKLIDDLPDDTLLTLMDCHI